MNLQLIIGILAAVFAVAFAVYPNQTIDLVKYVYGVYTPPPLSPLFQKGSILPYGELLNEDFTFIASMLLFWRVLDIIFGFRIGKIGGDNARYFALHAVANVIAVVAALPDLHRAWLGDVTTCLCGPAYSMFSGCTIVALHIYHVLAFKLTAADIFHHTAFILFFELINIPYKQGGGITSNYAASTLSGFPSFPAYVALVLYKLGYISKMKEREVSVFCNLWLRTPSQTIFIVLMIVNYQSGECIKTFTSIQYFWLVVVTVFFVYNGSMYGEEVIISYATHNERHRVAKEAKKQELLTLKKVPTDDQLEEMVQTPMSPGFGPISPSVSAMQATFQSLSSSTPEKNDDDDEGNDKSNNNKTSSKKSKSKKEN